PFVVSKPEDWPRDSQYVPADLGNTGDFDMVNFRRGNVKAWWADLGRSNLGLQEDQVKELVKMGQWKYQFALRLATFPTAYYDADGSGSINLIVQAPAADRNPDVKWRRRGQDWIIEAAEDR